MHIPIRRLCTPGLLALLCLLTACPEFEKSGARGPAREISVFSNADSAGPVMDALHRIYEYDIDVVWPEQAFLLDPVPLERWNVHRQVKSQIFVADMSRDDEVSRVVPGYLGEEGRALLNGGKPFRFQLHDRWAIGQNTLFFVGWSEEDLLHLLAPADSTYLRRQMESAAINSLVKTQFSIGQETSLPGQLARDYGWTMKLMSGFFGAIDPEGNFVKLTAEDPFRLILVHWVDETLPLNAETWNPVLDRVLWVYNEEDEVSSESTESFVTTFQNEAALKWEGVWQNEKYAIGGAFRAFGFHREGKSYLLIGMIYRPGGDKLPGLRQTEAMLHTFRLVS